MLFCRKYPCFVMAKALSKEEMPALDQKDLEILKLLQQNARMTIKEIAEGVHLSTTPVHERIKRMEESGVIRQYVTLLDASKVGKGLMVICYVSLRQHSKNAGDKFIKSVLEMNEVLECLTISGEFDFMLKIVAANMDEYYHFHVNKLSSIENVGNVQSVFVMGVIKQTHQLVF
jgi:Lrp/AsnC family transcriptional regulator, leucine-responsive regulatory protein